MYLARRSFAFLIDLVLLVSCQYHGIDQNRDAYINEFYLVLNDLGRNELVNDSVILCRTKPVYKTIYGNHYFSKDKPVPPPPPEPGIISFHRDMFNTLFSQSILDAFDIEFMYQSVDSTQIILIDSSKVNLIVVSESISEKFDNSSTRYGVFNEIERKHGTPGFIVASTPVFNNDFTKVILAINFHHSSVSGFGRIYVLEKRSGEWKVIHEIETWRQ